MCPPKPPAKAPAKGDAKGKGSEKAKPVEVVQEVVAPPAPPMRVFLVIAHPEPHQRSFCHAIYRKAIETLKLNNHEVVTTDLYSAKQTQLPSLDDFDEADPSLSYGEHQRRGMYKDEILRDQARIEWCTHLFIFTPLYWLAPNSAVMGWWEKVFGEGWAFAPDQVFEKGLLAGKKAMVAVTTGQPQTFYGKDAVNVTVEELMYSLTFRCFARCGFTPLRTQAFFGLSTANAESRVEMLNAWGEHVMTLETRDAIEFQFVQETGTHLMETDKVTNHKILAGLGDMQLCKPKDPYAFD